jgi:hypothetical protein
MRAFLLVSFILFSLLCLSGCVSQTALMPTLPVTQAPTQTALSASQPTGTPTTTLIPSYAPSLPPPLLPTEPASATPTPQLQVLDYPSYGLRLALPAGYHWAKQAVTGDLLLSVEIKQGSDSTSGYYLPPIGLRVFTKAAGVRLVDWFYGKQGDCGEYGKPPPAGAYFIAPMINNRMDFQSLPALRYESGC